jgi:ABC-type Fe3+/spermidine/putrescine transport system ATPase subunit
VLQLVAGLIPPDGGKVVFGSENITSVPPEKRGFGMVFQQPLLFPHMTVLENVTFGLKMKGWNRQRRWEEGQKMLARVGLAGLEKRMPSELSGGQQQRVSLARALVTRPNVLLMDEPFSALDPGLREEMRELLSELHREIGMTILFVTHDQEEAFLLADRIGVMKEGRLLQVGKPRELFDRPQSLEVARFLGAKNLIPGEWKKGAFYPEGMDCVIHVGNGLSERVGWIWLRPEWFQPVVTGEINGTPTDYAVFNGTVIEIRFWQGIYRLIVQSGSHRLEVIENPRSEVRWRQGQAITLCYPLSHLQWFDEV